MRPSVRLSIRAYLPSYTHRYVRYRLVCARTKSPPQQQQQQQREFELATRIADSSKPKRGERVGKSSSADRASIASSIERPRDGAASRETGVVGVWW
uniref:Uncharacterized protein n=1 Tax=Trichogramma kaykai TaxID=54128 RepID=A0ABD2WJB5_9HYME